MADLFRRTAVYKVGHHASHNATLKKDETGAPRYSTRDWAAWVLTGNPE